MLAARVALERQQIDEHGHRQRAHAVLAERLYPGRQLRRKVSCRHSFGSASDAVEGAAI
jgi:hypothetical protein